MEQLMKLIIVLVMAVLLGVLINFGIVWQRYDQGKRYLHCRNIAAWVLFLFLISNQSIFQIYVYGAKKIIQHEMLAEFWASIWPENHPELFVHFQYFIICNYLLLISAVILFAVIRVLFRRAKTFIDTRERSWHYRFHHFPWILAESFYEEDEENGTQYCLKPEGNVGGMWASRMMGILLVVLLLEMVPYLLAFTGENGWFQERLEHIVVSIYFLPVCLIILMEQIYFFLEGKQDYEGSYFQSDEIGYTRSGALESLVDNYRTQFSQTDVLLHSYIQRRKNDQIQIHNDLMTSQSQDCAQPEILHILNQQLTDAGVNTVSSYQNALSSLLNGDSINVRDHIQGEFLIYLAAYMSFYISQGKSFLILCKNHRKAEMIAREVDQALKKINKFTSIWKTSKIEDADSNCQMNILICGYQDFVSHSLLSKRTDFFRVLKGCVLTDGLEFCAQGNVQKELIFTELEKVQQNLEYMLISDEDNDSLRTAFESFTGKEIRSFHHDELPEQAAIMVWKEESYHKIQRCLQIGDIEDPYIGLSVPLALVGIKAGLSNVQVIAGDRKGYQTYFDNMKMSSQEISYYMGANYTVENMIHYNRFRLEDTSELEMLILYDSEFNYYNRFWSWLKYGGKIATLIHIISPPYMLREYMAANMDVILARNNIFDALIPYQSILDRSRYLAILLELSNKGMNSDELEMKVLEYNWPSKSIEKLLEHCLKGVLSQREYYNIYECFQFTEIGEFDLTKNEYVRHTQIKLTDENIKKRIQNKLIFATMVEKKNIVEELPILKSNIYNYYLRGQIVPIGGYMQRIVNISDNRIFVEQTAAVNRLDYYQTSEFELRNLKKEDESLNLELLQSALYTGDVVRKIYGYWESNNGIDFSEPERMNFINIKDVNNQTICMEMENVNIMKLRLKKDIFGDKEQEAANLAAFMMQEVFKVLFPYSYMNLFAVIEFDPGSDYWERIIHQTDSCTYEERVHSILPFVRKIEGEREDAAGKFRTLGNQKQAGTFFQTRGYQEQAESSREAENQKMAGTFKEAENQKTAGTSKEAENQKTAGTSKEAENQKQAGIFQTREIREQAEVSRTLESQKVMEKENQDFLDIYLIEFTELEMGMISTLRNNMNKMFRIMMIYLNWYLGKQKEMQKKGETSTEHTSEEMKMETQEAAQNTEADGPVSEIEELLTDLLAEDDSIDEIEISEKSAKTAEWIDAGEPNERIVTGKTSEAAEVITIDVPEKSRELAELSTPKEKTVTEKEDFSEEAAVDTVETGDLNKETFEEAKVKDGDDLDEVSEKEVEDTADLKERFEGETEAEDADNLKEGSGEETEVEDSDNLEEDAFIEAASVSSREKFASYISEMKEDVKETRLKDVYPYSSESTVEPCYLNLGASEISSCFATEEWYKFLKRILVDYQDLKNKKYYYSNAANQNECSFCGRKTLIIDIMDDGRRICNNCREHQVSQKEEIMKVYKETVQLLQDVYDIEFKGNIRVQMKSAKAIRQETQMAENTRVLGFYCHKTRELWIEARGPRNAVKDTIIHELTHAWQYQNLDMAKLDRLEKQENGMRLLLLEGHAAYMEVDAMKRFGEERYAKMLEDRLFRREDEYGLGYRLLKDYFENLAAKGSHMTPYKAMEGLVNSKNVNELKTRKKKQKVKKRNK